MDKQQQKKQTSCKLVSLTLSYHPNQKNKNKKPVNSISKFPFPCLNKHTVVFKLDTPYNQQKKLRKTEKVLLEVIAPNLQ